MLRFLFCLIPLALSLEAAPSKPFAFGSVHFERNQGQTDPAVLYLARARGQQVFLTDTGIVFAPPNGDPIRMDFPGAGTAHWQPDSAPSESISYFLGNDPAKWVKSAPVFNRIVWHGVYPGVDIAFYGIGDRLEYDLILAPHADPSRIRIQFNRASKLQSNGSLVIPTSGGLLKQQPPQIWQEITPGNRSRVEGKFIAAGHNTLRLALSRYQKNKTLTVDPVLEMSTYIGGENDDEIVAITDGAFAGNTRSLVFPNWGASQRKGRDIFLRGTGPANPNQTSRADFYSTIVVGGSGDDELAGISVDRNSGGYYLAGTTNSTDFPATAASQYHGGASDGFVAYFSVSQVTFAILNNAFYLGGSGEDRITGLSGDGTSFAFVGVTDSPDFQTNEASQRPFAGGKDIFYGLLSNFHAPIYGLLGGTGDDTPYAVAVRNLNSIWIGGETRSTDFPFADGSTGLSGASDAFLTEISISSNTAFGQPQPVNIASYRFGGSGEDSIRALVATPSTITGGLAYIGILPPPTIAGIGFAGVTTSTDLPVLNAAQPQPGGDRDAFVGMWDRTSSAPRWLTYVGGSGPDEITAIAQNWAGDLYVGGWSSSTDLPVLQPLQTSNAGGEDGMFAILDYQGRLQHLTYFGGSGDDRIRAVRVISNGVARIAGSTTSTDLPQRLPTQNRGGRLEGFLADIGSDYFLGPNELSLPKDGQINFSVRAARTAFRTPVTYRSADPSRVRLVYLGRSLDQVTAAPEDNIAVEGLDDTGQVDIIVTAPGYTTKTISVKLSPGVFVPFFNLSSTTISTWATSNTSLFAYYSAFDPATGKAAGNFVNFRAGVTPPVFHWSVSDPSVFALVIANGSTQLQPLKSGTSVVSLAIDGYNVFQGDRIFIATGPTQFPFTDLHLGRDLTALLPLTFTFNGFYVSPTTYRGTLSARSADPSRLLLSASPTQPGLESLTVSMAKNLPTIYAQALADDGPVQVLLSSTEFDGEIPVTVILEPSNIFWGISRYSPNGNVLDSSSSLTIGGQQAPIFVGLQGISGSFGSLRPGVPPIVFKLANSNAYTVELNRLTISTNATDQNYKLTALAPGTSDLTLSSSNSPFPITPATVHIDVKATAVIVPSFQPASVGNGLQQAVNFPYTPQGADVSATSDDPSLVLVSASANSTGSASVVPLLDRSSSSQYTFFIQALKSTGTTTVRVRFPEGERTFPVTLLPSGVGFDGVSTYSIYGYDRYVTVRAFALDPDTGIGIIQQTPQPGPGITARFSSDGAPITRRIDSLVLTAAKPQDNLDFSLPPAGLEATLTVSTDSSTPVSPLTSTLKLKNPVATEPTNLSRIVLARGTLYPFRLVNSLTAAATVTTGDPRNVLLSPTATDQPSESIQLERGSSLFFIHALGDSGVVTLKIDTPDTVGSTVQVALQPLQLSVYGSSVTVGTTATYTLQLSTGLLRPGVGPFRLTARTTDPSIAKVVTPTVDLAAANSGNGSNLLITGVSPGTTKLIIEGPDDIYSLPVILTITVPLALQTTPALPSYTLGRNLQGATQISLGSGFSNPNGTIVTLTSSDPSVLLLSRAGSTTGSASVVVAVPAITTLTQAVYLQAIGNGDATIRVTANGTTPLDQAAAVVHVVPSRVSCGFPPVSIPLGSKYTLRCFPAYTQTASQTLPDVGLRPSLSDLTIKIASSDPGVFTVQPASATLFGTGTDIVLTSVAPGSANLQVTPPSGFGPSPNGSEALPVSVVLPPLNSGCAERYAQKDSQIACLTSAIPGTVITATSSHPSLLLVSNSQTTVGGVTATATAVTGNQGVEFNFQALADAGTAEVVFSAPGYQDLRIAVALRPSLFTLASPSQNPFSFPLGGITNLTVTFNNNNAQLRPGTSIPIDIVSDSPGIVAITPTHFLYDPRTASSVQIKGLAVGTTFLRMSVPQGFQITGTPIGVTVTAK